MDPQIIQNFRYKLQKRIRRLNSVDTNMFALSLRQFWRFFDNTPIFGGVMDLLIAKFPEINNKADQFLSQNGPEIETEEEAAAIGYQVLRNLANAETDDVLSLIYNLAHNFGFRGKANEALEIVRDGFLEPFYDYLDEQLDDQRAMLALILRYKHRCEWFYRNRLFEIIQNTPRFAEKSLALDLYSFLYDQGIEFTIEPSSISGEIDLIASQGSKDPLLLDTKIFDADSRGKSYILKAFNQIYTYTQQYNEPFGYLTIFKTSDKDLNFSISSKTSDVPVVIYNHKTIFLLVIDIFSNPKPVSQRDPLQVISVSEEELIHELS